MEASILALRLHAAQIIKFWPRDTMDPISSSRTVGDPRGERVATSVLPALSMDVALMEHLLFYDMVLSTL